jgi:hypothetical protein
MADHAQILFTLQYRSMADEWRLSEHDHTWVTDDVINRIYNKKQLTIKRPVKILVSCIVMHFVVL